jgi:hypothetical protein
MIQVALVTRGIYDIQNAPRNTTTLTPATMDFCGNIHRQRLSQCLDNPLEAETRSRFPLKHLDALCH